MLRGFRAVNVSNGNFATVAFIGHYDSFCIVQVFGNITLLDCDQFIEGACLAIDDGVIHYAGTAANLPAELRSHAKLDGKGAWVCPGFVNSHTHVAMSFLREVAHSSSEMIQKIFFPMEASLTPEEIYLFSFPSLAGSIKSGVTTFVDHYYEIAAIERAVVEVGARGFLAETLADIGGAKPRKLDPVSVLEPVGSGVSDARLVQRILGPHAMDTSSREYLEEIGHVSKTRGVPIHMHMSQTRLERQTCLTRHQMTPVELAKECGLLGDKTLAVHLTSASKSDVDILSKENCFVGLCPTSQVIYEDLAPLENFFERGLACTLGTDCAASHDSMDILSELKSLYLFCRQRKVRVEARQLLRTVWDHPARWLGVKLGKLRSGYLADLIFIERGLESEPCFDPHLHLIATVTSRHVRDVMVQGEWILKDRQLTNIDEREKLSQLKNEPRLSQIRKSLG